MLLTGILSLYFLQSSYKFKKKIALGKLMRSFRVSHSESALVARYQVEFSSNGSRKGIHLGPTATSFQADDDFFYYKYPRFCLSLKNVQACLEKGIFDGEGLKSWKSIHVLDKTKKPHT